MWQSPRGKLSPREFKTASQKLVSIWNQRNARDDDDDNGDEGIPCTVRLEWKEAPCDAFSHFGISDPIGGYLSLDPIHVNLDESATSVKSLLEFEDAHEEKHLYEDDATIESNEPRWNKSLEMIVNIVYSDVYQVPMLLFRVSDSTGKLLSLIDDTDSDDNYDITLERVISPYYTTMGKHNKWNFITTKDHPYLNHPWYCLHPCKTSEFMSLMQKTKSMRRVGDRHVHNPFSEANKETNRTTNFKSTGDLSCSETNSPNLPHLTNTEAEANSTELESGGVAYQKPLIPNPSGTGLGPSRSCEVLPHSTDLLSVSNADPESEYVISWMSVAFPSIGLKLPKRLYHFLSDPC